MIDPPHAEYSRLVELQDMVDSFISKDMQRALLVTMLAEKMNLVRETDSSHIAYARAFYSDPHIAYCDTFYMVSALIVRMQVLRAFSRLGPRVFGAILGFTIHTQTGDNVIPAVMFSPDKLTIP